MNTIIVEDEYPSALRLQNMLKVVDDDIVVMKILESVESTKRYIQSNRDISLIFLDIHLTDGSGLEILKALEKPIPVIFTTAYDQYALDAFQYLSVDYLLKPIKETELKRSVNKYRKNFAQSRKALFPVQELIDLFDPNSGVSTLIGRIGKNHYPIKTTEIAYFYAEERETWAKTLVGKEYLIPKTLEELERKLPAKDFFRVNRKAICSRRSIVKFKILAKSKIELKVEQSPAFDIIISAEKAGFFKKWISDS